MNQQEFKSRLKLKEPLTPEEWETVHTVYQFHPMISEINGKDQIANIYKIGGIGLIQSMIPVACQAEAIETKLQNTRLAIDNLEREQNESLAELHALRKQFQPNIT